MTVIFCICAHPTSEQIHKEVYSKIEIQKIKRVGSDTSKEVWNDAHVLKNRQWLSSVRDNARADP